MRRENDICRPDDLVKPLPLDQTSSTSVATEAPDDSEQTLNPEDQQEENTGSKFSLKESPQELNLINSISPRTSLFYEF